MSDADDGGGEVSDFKKADFGKLSPEEQAAHDEILVVYEQAAANALREYQREKANMYQSFTRDVAMAVMDLRKKTGKF